MDRLKSIQISFLLVIIFFIVTSVYAAESNQISIADGSLLIEACRNQFSLLVWPNGFPGGYSQAVVEIKVWFRWVKL